jgi:light-regulated signal transduction histidine kinase (bacteriophytochrome)
MLKEAIVQRTNLANNEISQLVDKNQDLERTNKEYLRFIQMLSNELV